MINLKVKTLDARTHDFSVDEETTVHGFKEKIQQRTSIPVERQRLIYLGRVLEDEAQLRDFDMEGKVVHVAERPPPDSALRNSAPSLGTNEQMPQMNFHGLGQVRERFQTRGMRNSPLFRALDGLVVGTMAMPMDGGPVIPFNSSPSFCMNRITVARHMLACADNIAAYLEDPTRGLNNMPLDILTSGRWTMESTVVEVGISTSDIQPNHNILDMMVQGAVSAALRRNGNANVTVVQLPAIYNDVSLGDHIYSNNMSGQPPEQPAEMPATDTPASPPPELGSNENMLSVLLRNRRRRHSTPLQDRWYDMNAYAARPADAEETATAAAALTDAPAHEVIVTAEDTGIIDSNVEQSHATANAAEAAAATAAETAATDINIDAAQDNTPSTSNAHAHNNSADNDNNGSTLGRRTSTSVLADVLDQQRRVQTRLEPFVQQFYELLRNEPTFAETDTEAREQAQRLFDRVSEAMHYMSHAQHSISDLMLDFSLPAPRYLTCRPILVEQSGYMTTNSIGPVTGSPMPAQQQPHHRHVNAGMGYDGSSGHAPSSWERMHRNRPMSRIHINSRSGASVRSSSLTTSNRHIHTNHPNNPHLHGRINNYLSNNNGNQNNNTSNNTESSSRTQTAQAATTETAVDLNDSDDMTPEEINALAAASNEQAAASVASTGDNSSSNYENNQSNNAMSDMLADLELLPPIIVAVHEDGTREAVNLNNTNGHNQAQMSRVLQAVLDSTSADDPFDININNTGTSDANTATLNPNNDASASSNNVPTAQTSTLNADAESYTPRSAAAFGNGNTRERISVNRATSTDFLANIADTSTPRVERHGRDPRLNLPQHNTGGWNPRLQSVNNMMTTFDRFLPCNSHHIQDMPVYRMHQHQQRDVGAQVGGRLAAYIAEPAPNSVNFPLRSAASNARLRELRNLLVNGRRNRNNNASNATAAGSSNNNNNATNSNNNTNNNNNNNNNNNSSVDTTDVSSSSNMTETNSTHIAVVADASNNRDNNQTNNNDNNNERNELSEVDETMHDAARTSRRATMPPTPAARRDLRRQTLRFLELELFECRPITSGNISLAVERAVTWFSEHLLFLPQYELPEYDARASVLKMLRNMLPSALKLCSFEHNALLFDYHLRRIVKSFLQRLYSLFVLCVGHTNAEMPWRQVIYLLQAHLGTFFHDDPLHIILGYMDLEKPRQVNVVEAEEFVVLRTQLTSSSTSATPTTTTQDTERLNTSSTSTSASKAEPMETDDMEVTTNIGEKMESDVPPEEDIVLPPPVVTIGSETWHQRFPESWVPLLARDQIVQNELATETANNTKKSDTETTVPADALVQEPYSDAYIAGMPMKRRKLLHSKKPPTDVADLLSDCGRKAMTALNLKTATNSNEAESTETISMQMSMDPEFDASFAAALCSNINERLQQTTDYQAERFPNTAKFLSEESHNLDSLSTTEDNYSCDATSSSSSSNLVGNSAAAQNTNSALPVDTETETATVSKSN